MNSFRVRLLLVGSLVLAVFLLISAAGIDQAFVQSALQSQRDRMQGLVYALIGAAEPGPADNLTINPDALPDPRFKHVQSGLEAVIFDQRGDAIWRSPNLAGALPPIQAPPVGSALLREQGGSFIYSFGIRWLGESNHPRRFTLALIENRSAYNAQIQAFRRTLWTDLVASGAALILVQFFLLRWGVAPLRRLAGEIREIEAGERANITSHYPSELQPVTENLNAMIRSERQQLQRYRNALGDLAHSLKTPLAVLRGVAEDPALPVPWRQQLNDPLDRMQDIAEHQLRRAATAGRRILAEPMALAPLANKVIAALAKVHRDKNLRFANEVPPKLRARADAGDLYEMLGNLLDNAAKWARGEVRICAQAGAGGITIEIEDDGPGFPPQPEVLLERGVRADSRVPGQGIGLATVADIVRLNDGRIELGASTLGGARVRVLLPR
ncbi:MAG: HAMP domain-containing protein [Gammaproteobacteria bacterium]|nr:HAMP domain-containing protein [Gammaproteobacteria bacterium]